MSDRKMITYVRTEDAEGYGNIFEAPPFSYIHVGDHVRYKDEILEVVDVVSCFSDNEEAQFFVKAISCLWGDYKKTFDRLASKVKFEKFEYGEEDDNAESEPDDN